jgi:chromosome segregation ATPase
MIVTVLYVIGAVASTLIAGYLFGLWRGQGAREALRIELEGIRKTAFDAKSAASTAHAEAEWLRGSAAEAKVEASRLNIELTHARTTLQRTRKTCMSLQSEVARFRKGAPEAAPTAVEKVPDELTARHAAQVAELDEELTKLRAAQVLFQSAEERAKAECDRLREQCEKLTREHDASKEGAARATGEAMRARKDAARYRLLASAVTDDLRRTKEAEERARTLLTHAQEDVRRAREEAEQARADAATARKQLARAERHASKPRDEAPRRAAPASDEAGNTRWEETAREISAMRSTLSAITLRLALMTEGANTRDTERPEALNDVVGNDDLLGCDDDVRTGTAG